jgi:hypothetical protein
MYDLNRLNKRIGGNMGSKKKTATKVVEPVEQIIDSEPPEEPSIQLDELPVEKKTEQVQKAEPEKSAEPQPVVEVVAEPAPAPVPPKLKPLTLISLHNELEALRQIVDQQAILIKQLMETPARQRKPPTSNGKVAILDKMSQKTYPSKNNLYLSLLKAGELKELVEKGIFGSNPEKNTFGVYALLRAWPDRFEIVKSEETKVA